MRLLNVSTLQLAEYFDKQVPKYAILSHTWGPNEETFRDYQRDPSFRPKSEKVVGCCAQAKYYGYSHVWIDTLCIDKSSSVELSEAINSMFAWYKKSEICLVYLEDISSIHFNAGFRHGHHLDPKREDGSARETRLRYEKEHRELAREDLGRCRWFTRGWTLQELVAPSRVHFFDHAWSFLGRKCPDMTEWLSDITKIPPDTLACERVPTEYSVAQRMSWAANRVTTRTEDRAYCLLGLFGINMPLLYGEGNNAFRRLQEEIIRVSADHSILASRFNLPSAGYGLPSFGCLAASPASFAGCQTVLATQDWVETRPNVEDSDESADDSPGGWTAGLGRSRGMKNTDSHFTMTNKGLLITLDCIDLEMPGVRSKTTLALLRCNVSDEVLGSLDREADKVERIAVLLRSNKTKQVFWSSVVNPPLLLSERLFQKYGTRREMYLSCRAENSHGRLFAAVWIRMPSESPVPTVAAVFPAGCSVDPGQEAGQFVARVSYDMALTAKPRDTTQDRAHTVLIHFTFDRDGINPQQPDFVVRLDFQYYRKLVGEHLNTVSVNPLSCSVAVLGKPEQLLEVLAADHSGRYRWLDDKTTGLAWSDRSLQIGDYTCSIFTNTFGHGYLWAVELEFASAQEPT
ncbi:hypothetical protein MAPG_07819 [Magnaporthiopsis poae ATCC 64411]|uniref:Heterokaryon incompatibility domain-containing protein n=1 Tax=Magnaporthiopsis poae (strain ATCC 64411 / 73-15) TaxID=644358 RepID=A0A0C4E5P5_MAGP6|nr:hypothetical protein MAPG_07819 [Magnaporthiopsis poae ATCC 64411]